MPTAKPNHDALFTLPPADMGQLRSEAVLNRLTMLIAEGHLADGDLLPPEGEMAARFNVSKPTVREALRKLEMMGVIDIVHGRGSSVRQITAEPLQVYLRLAVGSLERGLSQVIEFRRAIEVGAAGLAARNHTPPQADALTAHMSDMQLAAGDHDAWVAWDIAFHGLIARMTGNTLMAFMVEAMRPVMEQTISKLHSQKALRDAKMTLERHVAIADAILAGDAAAAQTAMDTHFVASIPVAMQLMQSADAETDKPAQ